MAEVVGTHLGQAEPVGIEPTPHRFGVGAGFQLPHVPKFQHATGFEPVIPPPRRGVATYTTHATLGVRRAQPYASWPGERPH